VIVAVTGASGSLGRALVTRLAGRGWTVRALVRDPAAFARLRPGIAAARCDLPDVVDAAALAGVDALVHAAYPTRLTDVDEIRRVNEEGTRRLLAAAREAGVARAVFVSSIAAAPDAPSHYARSKHALESLFDPARDAVVRPGLILAREGQGLFQQMRDAMRRTHALPVFGGGRQPLQTVHVDDVCEAIARVIEHRLGGAFNVAEPDPMTFAAFLRAVARGLGIRCVLVPLPFAPVLAVVRALEARGIPFPLRSESLLGIRALRQVPVAGDLRRLDLRVRPAAESLADVLGGPFCAGGGPV
jgi:nucleoside-diphosphate-sugar epimerase